MKFIFYQVESNDRLKNCFDEIIDLYRLYIYIWSIKKKEEMV